MINKYPFDIKIHLDLYTKINIKIIPDKLDKDIYIYSVYVTLT